MMIDDLDDSYVPLDEAAQRMGLTEAQVLDLVQRKALRGFRYGGWGEIMVQPALTNVEPKPAAKAPAVKAVQKTATRRAPSKTGPRQP